MATDADGDIRILIEQAAEMGLTISGLTQVTLTKPAGTLRSFHMMKWLSDSDRAGYYEFASDLVPFHGSKETHDVFEFWFTNPNTAMEFKLAFG